MTIMITPRHLLNYLLLATSISSAIWHMVIIRVEPGEDYTQWLMFLQFFIVTYMCTYTAPNTDTNTVASKAKRAGNAAKKPEVAMFAN